MHKIYTHIIPEKASDEVDETVFLILTAKKKKTHPNRNMINKDQNSDLRSNAEFIQKIQKTVRNYEIRSDTLKSQPNR